MKFCLVIVLALIAIASASRLPLPEALQEKYHYLMKEDPIDLLKIPRVIGGSTVSNGGRPYQVILQRSGSFICGGSWITSRTVLTAAHCVHGYENSPTSFSIRYNTLSQSSGTVVTAQRIVKHASYSSSTINFDYALVIIASAFSPGTNAAVGSLAGANNDPASGAAVIVSGFGRTSSGGSVSQTLLQASLNVVARSTCQGYWGSGQVTVNMICAHSASRSACNGDSGGPLTAGGVIVGVVSWGPSSCVSATLPTAYARVGTVTSWISSNSS